jgi:hypothetical protein
LLAAVFKDVEGNLAAFDKAINARLLNGLDSTNTSLPPRSGAIKARPFVTLNHLTVPLGTFDLR